jgi:pimeloyl-ACP methyl ester carboxylesterase
MTFEDRIRRAEEQVFAAAGLQPEASYVDLAGSGGRVRVLGFGRGQPLVLLHGVGMCAASWTPLLRELQGFRVHAVDLPGHGLSDPVAYRRGEVRGHAVRLIDDLLDALSLGPAPVVGHSLGGMFALWHAAARPGPIGSLVALASPAVAIPGSVVRFPLSPMTVRGVGPAMLRGRTPRRFYRSLLRMALGPAAVAALPRDLLDLLRLTGRRPDNARTVGALMHAVNGFRRPRPESVLSADELARVTVPAAFMWGTEDAFLPSVRARPWVEKIPHATLHEVPAGHAPHFEDPTGAALLITQHLTATGFPPAGPSRS